MVAFTFSGNMIFGMNIEEWSGYLGALASVFRLILGKFSYYQFQNASPKLGPLYLLTFNFIINWVCMNMYITILLDVFAEEKDPEKIEAKRFELLDHMIKNLMSKYRHNFLISGIFVMDPKSFYFIGEF